MKRRYKTCWHGCRNGAGFASRRFQQSDLHAHVNLYMQSDLLLLSLVVVVVIVVVGCGSCCCGWVVVGCGCGCGCCWLWLLLWLRLLLRVVECHLCSVVVLVTTPLPTVRYSAFLQ